MNKPNVLFLSGIRDDYETQVARIDAKGRVLYTNSGTCDIHSYLKPTTYVKHTITLDLNPRSQIVLPPNLVLIVNQISEPDTHKKTLKKVQQLQNVLPSQILFLNDPQSILKTARDSSYALLKDIPGVLIPKTVRSNALSPFELLSQIKQENMAFPIIIREAGAHGGKTTLLLEDEKAVKNLFSIAMDGRDYYLTEFVDYAREGVYHKVRIILVEGKAYFRHLYYAKDWMIHGRVAKEIRMEYPDIYAQEVYLLEHFYEAYPELQHVLSAIYEKVQLDIFGIDCDIRPDGSILIFEANANMLTLKNFEESPNRYDKPIMRIKQAINDMVLRRIRDFK